MVKGPCLHRIGRRMLAGRRGREQGSGIYSGARLVAAGLAELHGSPDISRVVTFVPLKLHTRIIGGEV